MGIALLPATIRERWLRKEDSVAYRLENVHAMARFSSKMLSATTSMMFASNIALRMAHRAKISFSRWVNPSLESAHEVYRAVAEDEVGTAHFLVCLARCRPRFKDDDGDDNHFCDEWWDAGEEAYYEWG